VNRTAEGHDARGKLDMKDLTERELASFREEIAALLDETTDRLGQEDVDYVTLVARVSRYLEIAGRVLIHASLDPVSWSVGVASLAGHFILENMELGHNILHGQYDWMEDPRFDSRTYAWDNVIADGLWKKEHNGQHHAFTNIVGKDPDVCYGLYRMTDKVKWYPYHLVQPVSIFVNFLVFEYAIAAYVTGIVDRLAPKNLNTGKIGGKDGRAGAEFAWKMTRKNFKNYVFYPALGGLFFPKILAGNYLASVLRNVWAATVIYCGHFTENARMFTEEEAEAMGKEGYWYRQVLASGNFTGGKFLSILSGHLNYQIEHHLFPRVPAWRYRQLAPRVREICEKHGVFYNTGTFSSQFRGVVRRMVRHAVPRRAGIAEA